MVAGARWEPRVLFLSLCLLSCGRLVVDIDNNCSVDAEWIMEKKDLRRQQQHKSARQEMTAASPVDGSPTDSSGLSPLGGHTGHGLGGGAMDNMTANAYRPEMDEMKCLLWAHGGLSILLASNFSLFIKTINRRLFFRERGSGKVRSLP